jgi:uncharacterized protein YndB with AHSA1/START domain
VSVSRSPARAIADVTEGVILATVDIAAPIERVFRGISDPTELVTWWGSPDTYQTEAWDSDFRVGGKWEARGRGREGRPYAVRGEFLVIDPPHRLVQTWSYDWDAAQTTTVSYQLEAIEGGTRLTVRHSGFGAHHADCRSHGEGWQMVLGWLRAHVETARYFHCRLLPPRPDFARTMSDEERAIMNEHVAYWTKHARQGTALVFGPVADPAGVWGVAVLRVYDTSEVEYLQRNDPVIRADRGFRYETLPMVQAIVGELKDRRWPVSGEPT